MPVFGKIIVIRRNGTDGSQFPITSETCVFGKALDCDVRVQLPYVSLKQCELRLEKNGKFTLHNISEVNQTTVNNKELHGMVSVHNKDVITIVDRSFRFEYPENSPFCVSAVTPTKTPLGECQVSTQDQQNSPFGMLVNDMKSIIKNGTPKRQKKNSMLNEELKQENQGSAKRNSLKATPKEKSTPKAKRRSSLRGNSEKSQSRSPPCSTSKAPKDCLKSPVEEVVNGIKNASEDSEMSSISVDVMNVAVVDETIHDDFISTKEDSNDESSVAKTSFHPQSNVKESCPIDNNVSADITDRRVDIVNDGADDNQLPCDHCLVPKSESSSANSSNSVDLMNVAMLSETSTTDFDNSLGKNSAKLEQRRSSRRRSSSVRLSGRESTSQDKDLESNAVDLASNVNDLVDHLNNSPENKVRKQEKTAGSCKKRRSSQHQLSSPAVSAVLSSEDMQVCNTSKTNTKNSIESALLPEPSVVHDKSNEVFEKRSKRRSSRSNLVDSPNPAAFEVYSSDDTHKYSTNENNTNVNAESVPLSEASVGSEENKKAPEEQSKRRSSRRSSLINTPNIIDSSMVVTSELSSSKISSAETTPTSIPKISLTPNQNSDELSADPYNFPDESVNSQVKKYKRRSCGSGSLNRKQTLLLFGSPRFKPVTPLRRSMGRLKRDSVPLMELEEDSAPVVEEVVKPKWEPLPHVEEVENNSSPIKKPRSVSKPLPASKLQLNGSPPPTSRRSRRVSFGPDLSPEQFLKSLPPNTPVRKGATPSKTENKKSKRKSVVAAGITSLSTVEEIMSTSFSSPVPTAQNQRKVKRTPTPFKPDPNKTKPKSLLQQVLNTTMQGKMPLSTGSPSPNLRKRPYSLLATTSTEQSDQNSCDLNDIAVQPQSNSAKKATKKRRSSTNTPIVSVHKTATNLHRRSRLSMSKPRWADIVKKPSAKQIQVAQKSIANKKAKLKKPGDMESTLVDKDRHVDSPDTIYIGRTRSRINPTRTPRPPKSVAPAKLNIPLDESLSGVPEMFASPALSNQEYDLVEDLKTPKSVGEMLVSPLSTPECVSSEDEEDISKDYSNQQEDIGASPDFSKNRRSSITTNGSFRKSYEEENQPSFTSDNSEIQLEEEQPPNKIRRTSPRVTKGIKIKNKSVPVTEHFGIKQLVKTPRNQKKSEPVTEHFGTKRLMKTPKNQKKSEPVAEHFGTKRLMKTPKSQNKSEPVTEHFGTKQLMKTPRNQKKSEPVAEHFGTKRLMKTPRNQKKSEPVTEHFGTKRLMKTPRNQKKSEPVAEDFGTKQLFRTPRNKNKSEPVMENLGLKNLFHQAKESSFGVEMDENFYLNNVFATPERNLSTTSHQQSDGGIIEKDEPATFIKQQSTDNGIASETEATKNVFSAKKNHRTESASSVTKNRLEEKSQSMEEEVVDNALLDSQGEKIVSPKSKSSAQSKGSVQRKTETKVSNPQNGKSDDVVAKSNNPKRNSQNLSKLNQLDAVEADSSVENTSSNTAVTEPKRMSRKSSKAKQPNNTEVANQVASRKPLRFGSVKKAAVAKLSSVSQSDETETSPNVNISSVPTLDKNSGDLKESLPEDVGDIKIVTNAQKQVVRRGRSAKSVSAKEKEAGKSKIAVSKKSVTFHSSVKSGEDAKPVAIEEQNSDVVAKQRRGSKRKINNQSNSESKMPTEGKPVKNDVKASVRKGRGKQRNVIAEENSGEVISNEKSCNLSSETKRAIDKKPVAKRGGRRGNRDHSQEKLTADVPQEEVKVKNAVPITCDKTVTIAEEIDSRVGDEPVEKTTKASAKTGRARSRKATLDEKLTKASTNNDVTDGHGTSVGESVVTKQPSTRRGTRGRIKSQNIEEPHEENVKASNKPATRRGRKGADELVKVTTVEDASHVTDAVDVGNKVQDDVSVRTLSRRGRSVNARGPVQTQEEDVPSKTVTKRGRPKKTLNVKDTSSEKLATKTKGKEASKSEQEEEKSSAVTSDSVPVTKDEKASITAITRRGKSKKIISVEEAAKTVEVSSEIIPAIENEKVISKVVARKGRSKRNISKEDPALVEEASNVPVSENAEAHSSAVNRKGRGKSTSRKEDLAPVNETEETSSEAVPRKGRSKNTSRKEKLTKEQPVTGSENNKIIEKDLNQKLPTRPSSRSQKKFASNKEGGSIEVESKNKGQVETAEKRASRKRTRAALQEVDNIDKLMQSKRPARKTAAEKSTVKSVTEKPVTRTRSARNK